VASYLRGPGTARYLRWSVSVLTLRDDRISEITSFVGDEHFDPFGLPVSLP
jgi:RNA polymerase sigma-70 factor (ECF subfamily)